MSKNIKIVLVITGIIFLIAVFLIGLGSALTPLLISFGMAYLVFPAIKKLENKGVKRHFAVVGIFTATILLLGLILFLVLPSLFHETKSFLQELPKNSAMAIEKVEAIALEMGVDIDINKKNLKKMVLSHTKDISSSFIKALSKSIRFSFSNISSWALSLLNLFLIPLFFFYVINDYERISKEIKSYIPKSISKKISSYASTSNRVLSGYIRGQIMVACLLSLLYGFGLWAVGLRFGLLIGFLSGLISIVPYAGITVGITVAIVIGLANYNGVDTLLGIIGVFLIVQVLEGFYLTPKLVGDKVGLSSLSTMLALIVGGNLFGLIGVLLAIPIAAIFKVILGDLKKEYQSLVS